MNEINLYSATVVPFTRTLNALHAMLDKIDTHAKSRQLEWHPKGMQEDALLQSRLISDQFPFVRQVQVACDNAKNGVARLAEKDAPKMEDSEKTIAELKKRIEATLAFLKTITPADLKGKESVKISLVYWGGKHLTGFEYVTQYLIPNFYFHVATAYSIMRKNGVQIGKDDYIGGLDLK